MRQKIQVLVTGANGQLGLTLRDLSKSEEQIQFHFYDSKEFDITEKAKIYELINSQIFHFCINCAAYTDVESAESDREAARRVNFNGVKNLVDLLKGTDTVLIHISTDYVFDGTKNSPYKEDDLSNPINEYGKSKLLGENYIRKNMERYLIIRTSWLYSNYGKNFYKSVKKKLLSDESLRINSSQFGSPTSTISLAKALSHIIKNNKNIFGIFHFSNKGLTNWYIFAKTIIELIDSKRMRQLIEIKEFKTRAKRPNYSKLDSSKFEKIFDYKVPNWKDALKKVVVNE